MKAFRFRLHRVLEWRRTELRREEAALEGLHARAKALEMEAAEVVRRRDEAQFQVARSSSVGGSEIAALDQFRRWSLRELDRIARRSAETREAIVKQTAVVSEARRRMRLIEKLQERRLAEWQVESDREIETMAGEFAVAQWRRLTGQD